METGLTVKSQNFLADNNFDFVKSWLNYVADNSPSSVKTYEKSIKQFTKWLAENNIAQPTRDDVRKYRNMLQAKIDADPAQMKANTAKLYLSAVKVFFRWLSSENLYPNVCDGVKGIKNDVSIHAKDALTIDGAQKVMATVNAAISAAQTLSEKAEKKIEKKKAKVSLEKSFRDKAIIALMMTCGLRTIEICRLNYGDIEKRRGKKFLMVRGKGRNNKAPVMLPKQVEKMIDEYLSLRGDIAKTEPLFVSTSQSNKGARLQTQTISRITKMTLKKAGFDSETLTAHSMRHTAATVMLADTSKGGCNIDISLVQLTLRHKRAETTQIYRHDLDVLSNDSTCKCADTILGGMA